MNLGSAAFIQNYHSFDQTVIFCGEIPLDSSKSVNISAGMNLIAYPFSTKKELNATSLKSSGALGSEDQSGNSDVVSTTNPDANFWLLDKVGDPNDGNWHNAL